MASGRVAGFSFSQTLMAPLLVGTIAFGARRAKLSAEEEATVSRKEGMSTRTMDVGWQLGGLSWIKLARQVVKRVKLDRVTDQSARLSYYFFFAAFPLLLFLTALLGLFAEPGTFLHRVLSNYVGAIVPHSASTFIESATGDLSKGSTAKKLCLGLLAALWSGSSGMSAIIRSLNMAYDVKKARPWWKAKLISIGLT